MSHDDTGWRCRRCAYPLPRRALYRCSECGRAFTPEKPRTYLRDGERRAWTWAIVIITLLAAGAWSLAALAGWVLIGMRVDPAEYREGDQAVAVFAWGAFHLGWIVIAATWICVRGIPRRWRWVLTGAGLGAMVVAGVLSRVS